MKNKIIIFLILVFNISQIYTGHGPSKIVWLQKSIDEGNLKEIEIYLKRGKDINQSFIYLEEALHTGKIKLVKAKEIAILLKKYKISFNSTVCNAATHGNFAMLLLLINLYKDINIVNACKLTPLLTKSAIARNCGKPRDNYIQTIIHLINSNAELNEKNDNGNTPLIIALANNYPEIVYSLLLKGADPNIVNNEGKTFFDYINIEDELSAHIKNKSEFIEIYKTIKKIRAKKFYETISKANGFNQDMPNDLVNIISDYDC